jgi:hypothetical protein
MSSVRRTVVAVTASYLVLAVGATSASAGIVREIILHPANNTGEVLKLQGHSEDSYTRWIEGGWEELWPGSRGEAGWTDDFTCPDICGIGGSVTYAATRAGGPSFQVTAHNPLSGDNSATCSPSAGQRCDIAYNRGGLQLNVNTNVYADAVSAPDPSLYVDADPVIDNADALDGIDYVVGPSRPGEVTTTLTTKTDRRQTRAARTHGSHTRRVTIAGANHPFELRLNQRGRRAVAGKGSVVLRLSSVFRAEDGAQVERSTKLRVVEP